MDIRVDSWNVYVYLHSTTKKIPTYKTTVKDERKLPSTTIYTAKESANSLCVVVKLKS